MPGHDVSTPGIGIWTPYTPTWASTGTAPALGNGTLIGTYVIIGKTLIFNIVQIMGSTTTYGTGDYSWTIPSGYTAAAHQTFPAWAVDQGTAFRIGMGDIASGGTAMFVTPGGAGTKWGASVPHVWADTDELVLNGTFAIN